MRTIPFRTVLEDVLGLAGYPYDTASQTQLEMAARFVNRHVRQFWEWGPWPEWTRAEYRPLAETYNETITYVQGDVVYYDTTDTYYVCTAALSAGNLPTNTNYWAESEVPVVPYIDYEQHHQTKIGRVWRVTRLNPYVTGRADQTSYPFSVSDNGIIVADRTQKRVWVLFSDQSPRFSAKAFDATASYQQYDVVYYPNTENSDIFPDRGQCYYADIDSLGAYVWVQVKFPLAAHNYVVNKAAADMLRYYGNKELAVSIDQMSEEMIQVEWDRVNTLAYQNVIGMNQ